MSDENPIVGIVKDVLESEQGKNLLSPVTKEVGEALGTIGNLVRFYMTDNLQRIFPKWWSYRGGQFVSSEAVKKIMPLLPAASMVSNEELQEKWAVLMETAVTDDGFLPSFGETLAHMTVEHVRFLDSLWGRVLEPVNFIPTYEPGRMPMTYSTLVCHFEPTINTGVNFAEFRLYGNEFSDEQRANYERLQHAKLVIDDVIRLGIISVEHKAEPQKTARFGKFDVPIEGTKTILRAEYSFSLYGVSFMRAVTPKQFVSNSEGHSAA